MKTVSFFCSFQIKNSILSLPRNFEHQAVEYHLRSTRYYEKPDLGRTSRFSNSYFSKILNEWKNLDKEVQGSPSISVFNGNLLQIIRPIRNPVYNICDIQDVKILTRLLVKFSPLNEHRFRHNFECLSPACLVEQLEKTLSTTSFTAHSSVLCAKLSLVKYQKLDLT